MSLYEKKIKNDGLKYLSEIKFEGLKELDLANNLISDIKVIEKIKF